MKFYGIDCQGYFKLQEFNSSLPTFVPGQDERRLIYLDTGAEDRIYLGADTGNKWERVVLDDGVSTYTNLVGELDTLYHPKGGSATTDFVAQSYNGAGDGVTYFKDNALVIDQATPAGDSTIYAGGAITSGKYLRWNDDYYAENSGTITSEDIPGAGSGGAWEITSNTGTSTIDAISTQGWVNEYFLKETDALTEDTASLNNYYTITVSDGRFVKLDDYYGDVVFNQPSKRDSGWTIPLGQQYFASYAWTGTEDGVPLDAIRQYSIVRRNATGDISANIGNLTATSAQYADLAEKYTCDESLPVGTVVEVSDGTEYEVVPCTFELSPVIVGAVSENPAHLMNSEADGLPIALTGRVPVRVVGEVNKGDFIVSAGNGQARKGEAHELTFKIGIALESGLQTGEKLVECIIK